MKAVSNDYKFCTADCRYMFEEDITCENGKYDRGDTVIEGCSTCECGFDGEMHCSTDAFCHLEDFEFERAECEAAGGFYQELCQGNIYAMRCTTEFYCQCAGDANFTCPQNSVCLTEFKPNGILQGNLQIWSDRGGRALGDIGICGNIPEIATCGNGVCDNKVLINQTAETILNCPQDCLN